jgi:hypothetical protein
MTVCLALLSKYSSDFSKNRALLYEKFEIRTLIEENLVMSFTLVRETDRKTLPPR